MRPDRPAPAARPAKRPRTAVVAAVGDLGAGMRRLTLEGDDLADLALSPFCDTYLKVVLCRDGATLLRTYTARAFEAGRCHLDVLLHPAGSHGEGPGTRWARTARVGDVVHLRGPGGKYAVPAARHHVLVGDRAALPAFENLVEGLGEGVRADVVLVTDGESRPLPSMSGGPADVRLVECDDAASALEVLAGWTIGPDAAGLVHGEAGFCRAARRFLRVERGIDPEASAYWMRGVDDEGWRAVKSGWKAPVDDAEAEAVRRIRG